MSGFGLVLALAVAAAPETPEAREIDLELAVSGGYGGRVSLGGIGGLNARWHAWGGKKISGGLELGVLAGYQNEPYGFTSSVFAPSEVSGSNHRVQALVSLGHGLRIMRLTVGSHFFIGWTNLTVSGALRSESLMASRSVNASASELTFGAVLHARFRLTDHVSLSGRVFAPVPNLSSGVNAYVMASLGVSVVLW